MQNKVTRSKNLGAIIILISIIIEDNAVLRCAE